MKYQLERDVACRLARKAGLKVLEMYDGSAEVRYKDKREPVTTADLASNEIILAGLRAAFPNDGILSEESHDDGSRLDIRRLWVIDPLDGTKEFVDRVGHFAVMIGLVVDGRPVLGAVYQPVGDRLWHGVVGEGAVLEEKGTSRVAKVSSRTRDDGLRLVVTRSHKFEGVEEIQRQLGITEVRQIGSVGLKVGAIISDEADIYVHISNYTKEWDACGPHAIIEAAGGQMTDLAGQPLYYNKKEVRNMQGLLATNGPVHDRAVEVVTPLAKALGVL